jgi:antitoxin ParD1/3/4
MRNTQPLTVTLPHDMAAMIKARVASGEYATESEVVRDGLRALLARDAAVEAWLRDEVAKSYDEYAAGSLRSVPAEEDLARLRSSFENRRAKSEKP